MLSFLFKCLAGVSFLGLAILVVVSAVVIPGLPDVDELKDIRMQTPLRVYSYDQSLLAEFGEKRRTPVTISQVPEPFIKAFLAAEDDRFHQHPGVDWQGILRAAINLALTGEKTQGGSTITMQVARNFFLTSEKTYLRKINEIYLALKIERELNKDEILELYLNKIFLGQRAYGIGAAAEVYYGRRVDELTLPQMAMIAGLPKAPSTTNPVTSPERARKRRSYVLARMHTLGFITRQEFELADNAPVTASLHRPTIELEAPYVAEMVRRHMEREFGDEATTLGYKVTTTIRDRNQLAANHALRKAVLDYDTRHGYRGPESRIEMEDEAGEKEQQLLATFPVIANLYPALVTEVTEDSFIVFLSGIGAIDIGRDGFAWARRYIDENRLGPEPRTAEEVVQPGDIVRIMEDDQGQWRLSQLPAAEGALVSLNPDNGATLALSGGFDFYRSSFNRVTQAKRQPGSGFKPFIYSAALEAGFTAASIINDAPLVRKYAGMSDVWRPENFNRRYNGPTRLREALIRSINIVSIKLLEATGIENTLEHITRFGLDTSELPRSLSLALGSGELTPWQLAAAYCVFANGGYRIEPYFIERIEDQNGKTVFEADPLTVCRECEDDPATAGTGEEVAGAGAVPADLPAEPVSVRHAPRVVDPRTVWIINSMTRDVIRRGTGTRALALNRSDLMGKTGTTNDQRDAWFFGYAPVNVTVTWLGFDDFRELGSNETGSRAALPMWIEYMRIALAGVPELRLEQPPGLITVRIDPETGMLASTDNANAIFEIFRPGHVPDSAPEENAAGIFNRGPVPERTPEQIF